MVFFTCNACGETMKKDKVETHWRSKCPDCYVLSCIDCGKDFAGDGYKAHTRCVRHAAPPPQPRLTAPQLHLRGGKVSGGAVRPELARGGEGG